MPDSNTIDVTFQGMFSYKNGFIQELKRVFDKKQIPLIKGLKEIIIEKVPEKAYHPHKRFKFCFFYEISTRNISMEIIIVFYNGWRIIEIDSADQIQPVKKETKQALINILKRNEQKEQ